MKFILAALLVIAVIGAGQAYNSSWGRRNSTDFLLHYENVVRSPVYNNYNSVSVNFPKSGQGNQRTITAIFVYDRFTNSSGASASLWSGGPGYKFATINLKSQYAKGINSTVEIYGK